MFLQKWRICRKDQSTTSQPHCLSCLCLLEASSPWSCPLPNQSRSHFVFTFDIALHSLLLCAPSLPTFLLVVLPAALCCVFRWAASSSFGLGFHGPPHNNLRVGVGSVTWVGKRSCAIWLHGLIVLYSIDRVSKFTKNVGVRSIGRCCEFICCLRIKK